MNRSFNKRLFFVASILFFSGCDLGVAPRFSVEIRTDRDVYGPGDFISVTLTNRSNGTIWYDPCHWVIERQLGTDQWENAVVPTCVAIALPPIPVEPMESATLSLRIPPQSSTYRFQFWLSTGKQDPSLLSDQDRLSNEFTVIDLRGQILFSTSFEEDSDTTGWQGVSHANLRNDAPAMGGKRSLFVSGGCIVPHAWVTLPPLNEDSYLILHCWGKNLGIGGSASLSQGDGSGKQISISVERREWSEYISSDTLFCPKGTAPKISLISGGFVASSMLVDLIEVRAVK